MCKEVIKITEEKVLDTQALKKAVGEMEAMEITVKCRDCGHKFDSKPHEWAWEDDTIGPPFQYPPECPECDSIETDPEPTEVEKARYNAKMLEVSSLKKKAEEEAMKKEKKCCECRRYQLCRDEGMLFDIPCNFHFPVT